MSSIDRTLYDENALKNGQFLRGVVVGRNDPRLEGRIQVVIPRLVQAGDPSDFTNKTKSTPFNTEFLENKEMGDLIKGSANTTNSMWARPPRKPAWRFHVPYVGDTVYLLMEDGDPDKLYYMDFFPSIQGDNPPLIWLRDTAALLDSAKKPNIHLLYEFKDSATVYYNENSLTREYRLNLPLNTYSCIFENIDNRYMEFQLSNKTRKQNHAIVMSEKAVDLANRYTQIEDGISLLTAKEHTIRIDDDLDHILAETNKGHKIEINDAKDYILIETAGGHKIKISDTGSGGITMTTSGGSKVDMNGSGSQIKMSNNAGAVTNMNGPMITSSAGGGKMVIGNGTVSFN